MCTRSHVCMQHDGWILFFHYSSIMKPQTGIFICTGKKITQFVIVFFAMQIACCGH